MKNDYYIPNISDIHIGYECEVCTNYGFESFNNNQEMWEKIIVGYKDEEGYTNDLQNIIIGIDDGYKPIRTPYLTKEQIEKEEWIQKVHWKDVWQFTKNNFQLFYYFNDHVLTIINTSKDCSIYGGHCPSINEFRIINKLLNIK